jgi:hypothetical protein
VVLPGNLLHPLLTPRTLVRSAQYLTIWKGDNGTLSPGVPTIQGTTEEIKRGSREEKDANGNPIRGPEDH